jgi:hypothetical protein
VGIFKAAYDLLVLMGQGVVFLMVGFVLLVMWGAANKGGGRR